MLIGRIGIHGSGYPPRLEWPDEPGGDGSAKILSVAAAVSLLALSACGTTTSDRALSGAGIGAATGAVGGALLGSPGTGA